MSHAVTGISDLMQRWDGRANDPRLGFSAPARGGIPEDPEGGCRSMKTGA
jgi:hypothetical protein